MLHFIKRIQLCGTFFSALRNRVQQQLRVAVQ